MANTAELKLGSETFLLSLNFNTTTALLAYQEALNKNGAAGLEETDIRGLLARIAQPGTPMSVKVMLVRTMLWALIASEQHPEWIDDPVNTARRLGTMISPFEIDKVNAAVNSITDAVMEHMVAEIGADADAIERIKAAAAAAAEPAEGGK